MEIVFRPAIASRGAKFTEHVNSRLSKIESFQEIIEEYKAGRAAGKCGPQLIAEKPKIMIDHGQALPSVKPFHCQNLTINSAQNLRVKVLDLRDIENTRYQFKEKLERVLSLIL